VRRDRVDGGLRRVLEVAHAALVELDHAVVCELRGAVRCALVPFAEEGLGEGGEVVARYAAGGLATAELLHLLAIVVEEQRARLDTAPGARAAAARAAFAGRRSSGRAHLPGHTRRHGSHPGVGDARRGEQMHDRLRRDELLAGVGLDLGAHDVVDEVGPVLEPARGDVVARDGLWIGRPLVAVGDGAEGRVLRRVPVERVVRLDVLALGVLVLAARELVAAASCSCHEQRGSQGDEEPGETETHGTQCSASGRAASSRSSSVTRCGGPRARCGP
jgi:hypothetical protein